MRSAAAVLALCLPHFAWCQEDATAPTGGDQSLPEEVIVTGDRSLSQLRGQLEEAEKQAYEVFNQFNDDERFDISCNRHQPTGTRIESQLCQPNFEREAMAAHGQAFLESYRLLLESCALPSGCSMSSALANFPNLHTPAMARIASQQEAYQRRMREVAQEHPEFLEAIIQYSQARERFEEARRQGD